MHVLDRYLRELREIHSTGSAVPETSFYGALENVFNEIGRSLKPRVRAVINLQNRGAGIPDGGFFTAGQLKAMPDSKLLDGQIPERGVLEVKSLREDLRAVIASEQVRRYLTRYGLILVTNYRDFVLLGKDDSGQVTERESYCLAENETEFWLLAARPQAALKGHGERFREYIKRALLHMAPLEDPRDVSWFLASYARDASARLEGVDLPALSSIREALEASLGVRFDGPKGEHFFRSTLVQTLFYGIFSAWVLWHKEDPGRRKDFDWRLAGWLLKVPMIQAMFEQLTSPTQLRRLGLVEVLDWAAETLKRVRSTEFFARFEEDRAVQYFYEPFLESFDPQLRKALGVWFTPPEVVRYMVARVDQTLRSELGVEDGLADPRVVVLDPCCGTGAYLLETVRRIADTLREKGGDALAAQDLKKIVMERIFGFELLPAPFVVAHLQLGLMLQALQVPLSEDKGERAGIFLSNALTGWEVPEPAKQHLIFPELEQERDGAARVKREAPILVILGNPPYNAFAGVSPSPEERRLVEVYKRGLISRWGVKKFNLDELYVRFFRIAERRITEMTGEGIVCFISNFSYLSDPSFVVLRERFVQEFDSAWIDCLNGDSRETGKTAPDGRPDPSIFSTEYNREGIRVGTAIGLFVRKREGGEKKKIFFRHFWGTAKREDLLSSLAEEDCAARYEVVHAGAANQYSLRPAEVTASYLSWPRLEELAEVRPILGVLEKRKSALCSIDRESLEKRMRRYGSPAISWEELARDKNGLTENAASFDARSIRKRVLDEGGFEVKEIRRLLVRPMDYRWCYYSKIPGLWNRSRPTLIEQCWEGNSFLVCRNKAVAAKEGVPFFFTSALGDEHAFHKDAYYLPLRIRRAAYKNHVRGQVALLEESAETTANISQLVRIYLVEAGLAHTDAEDGRGFDVWRHVLAIGYAPAYLEENASGLRQGWPRIPLPGRLDLLRSSAQLGVRLAELLETEKSATGVSQGTIRSDLRVMAVVSRHEGGALNPDRGDLELTAGWGHLQNGIVMPGRGRLVERSYLPEELEAIEKGSVEIGMALSEALDCLGRTTHDVWLNDRALWKNVPSNVWGYTIGGYQVIKKWLSYREREILGRGLTSDEVREVTGIVRRLAAILLMREELDANYVAVKKCSWSLPAAR